jgi:hypothetical protein
MNEREEFEKQLRQQADQRRQAEDAERKKQEAATNAENARRTAQAAVDRKAAEELLVWCKETFGGIQLPETNHVLNVTWRDAGDKFNWVFITTEHVAEWAGTVPLIAVECTDGKYAIRDGLEKDATATLTGLEAAKQWIKKRLGETGRSRMKELLDEIKHFRPHRGVPYVIR